LDDSTYQQLRNSKFYHPEVTEVIYDINQLEGMIAGAINVVEKGFDMVWDKMMFNFHFNHLHEGYEAMERLIDEKNLKIRLIVEAIPENIDQINSITNYEIRHLEDIRSNFGILDNRAYVVSIFHKGSTKPQQAFFSNSRVLIDKQQALFDKLWTIAIPLEKGNKQLETYESQGSDKVILKSDEIEDEIISLIDKCNRELIIFSSINILKHFIYSENIWKYSSILLARNARIKILVDSFDPDLLYRVQKINQKVKSNFIQLEYSAKLESLNECLIIIDGSQLLRIIQDNRHLQPPLIASSTSDRNYVLVQEILFEKYWNEISNLTMFG
jgi:hypothetical protein